MHLPVLVLALLTAFPSSLEAQGSCARPLADTYAVLDCEQADALLAARDPALDPLDADEDDDQDGAEVRRRASRVPVVLPAAHATASAGLRLPQPRATEGQRDDVPPVRERFLNGTVPRARAQLPDPTPAS